MTQIQREALAFDYAKEFLRNLRRCRDRLTTQQLRTLRGQALAGDVSGAERGLDRLIKEAPR